MLGWFLPALGLADQQYPSIALQPSVTLEGTMSSAQEPLETDVWADPAPGPKSLSMSTTGPGIHSPEWKVGATEGSRKGGPGLDVFDVPTDECGVSVYRNDDGRLEMFAIGPDDQVYHKAQKQTRKPEKWTDWLSLGGPARGMVAPQPYDVVWDFDFDNMTSGCASRRAGAEGAGGGACGSRA